MNAGELGFQAERLDWDYSPPASAAGFPSTGERSGETGAKARLIELRLFPRR
jgi:hypothetical protein